MLLRELRELVDRDRRNTAELLAYLAEVDSRRLYAPAGFPSMFAWCVGELRFSEEAAYRRIRVARVARLHPQVLDAIADGRLNLTSVLLLAPCLSVANADQLLPEAEFKSKADVELLVARCSPRPDVPTSIVAITSCGRGSAPLANDAQGPLALEPVAPSDVRDSREVVGPVGAPPAPPSAPPAAVAPPAHSLVKPLAPERFEVRMTLDQEAHDLLREAQALLASQLPSRDAALVMKRVLSDWVRAARRRKYGETSAPRPRTSHANGRYVPAAVMREVMERDGEQCTFRGPNGQRCPAREGLEYDHVRPVARGGHTCADNLRLRCRAHNQLEAERVFGERFMRARRARASVPGDTAGASRDYARSSPPNETRPRPGGS